MEYDGIEELTELENVEEMKGKVKHLIGAINRDLGELSDLLGDNPSLFDDLSVDGMGYFIDTIEDYIKSIREAFDSSDGAIKAYSELLVRVAESKKARLEAAKELSNG